MNDLKLVIVFITVIFILGVLVTTLLRLKRNNMIKKNHRKVLDKIILITDIVFMIIYIITIIVVGKYNIDKFILLFGGN